MSFEDRRNVRDPRTLSALAHPLRLGILEILTIEGPLTATELGDRLGESPANCSWHLRKLAEHDFVEEATGQGRKRPWQVRTVGLEWTSEGTSPAEQRAGREFEAMIAQRSLDRYLKGDPSTDAEWRDARSLTQVSTFLTVEELKNAVDEIVAVLIRHANRLTGEEERPEAAELVELVFFAGRVEMGTGEKERNQ